MYLTTSFVNGASNWYWLTVGQGLLSLQQVGVEGECCYFFCSLTLFHLPLIPYPSLSSSLLSLLSLFSLSLGDNTKWSTRVDMSLNTNTVNQIPHNKFVCGMQYPATCLVVQVHYDILMWPCLAHTIIMGELINVESNHNSRRVSNQQTG